MKTNYQLLYIFGFAKFIRIFQQKEFIVIQIIERSQPMYRNIQPAQSDKKISPIGKQKLFQIGKQVTYQQPAINSNFAPANYNLNASQNLRNNSYKELEKNRNLVNFTNSGNQSKANRYHLSKKNDHLNPYFNNPITYNSYNESTYEQRSPYLAQQGQQFRNKNPSSLNNQIYRPKDNYTHLELHNRNELVNSNSLVDNNLSVNNSSFVNNISVVNRNSVVNSNSLLNSNSLANGNSVMNRNSLANNNPSVNNNSFVNSNQAVNNNTFNANNNEDNIQNNRFENNQNLLLANNQVSRSNQVNNNASLNLMIQLYKMDGLFYKCFKPVKDWHVYTSLSLLILLSGAIIIQITKYLKPMASCPQQCMIRYINPFLIAFQSIILLARIYIFYGTYHSITFALNTAKCCNANVLIQMAQLKEDLQTNTSEIIFIAQGLTRYQQLSPQTISKFETYYRKKTEIQVKKYSPFSYYAILVSQTIMVVISMLSVIMLTQNQTNTFQKIVFILTFLRAITARIMVFVFIVFLPFIPFVILCALFNHDSDKAQLQRKGLAFPFNPTRQQILSGGETCPICMMDFTTENSVIILSCSDKHMFHQICIHAWLRVKNTCPTCRSNILSENNQ